LAEGNSTWTHTPCQTHTMTDEQSAKMEEPKRSLWEFIKFIIYGTPEQQAIRAAENKRRKEEQTKLDILKRQAYNEMRVKGEIEKAKAQGLKDSGYVEAHQEFSQTFRRAKKKLKEVDEDYDDPLAAVNAGLRFRMPNDQVPEPPSVMGNMFKNKPPSFNQVWGRR
jgi:uncharacterized membrane protein YgaE (UPF0421/DUF939 family)